MECRNRTRRGEDIKYQAGDGATKTWNQQHHGGVPQAPRGMTIPCSGYLVAKDTLIFRAAIRGF